MYILQAMKIKLQKYLIVTLLVLGTLPFTYAQVGINITDPNGGALLDVSSREKGVLIPRVNITDLTTIAPISGLISFAEEMAAESLLVYNINDTTGRGFHYWDGTTWVRLSDSINGAWSLIGNSGTNPTSNFIGTTDSVDFITKTNNLERMRVSSDGNIGVNGNPIANYKLYVDGDIGLGAIAGNTDDFAGVLGTASGDGIGVVGFTSASDNTSFNPAIYGQSTAENNGTGVIGLAEGTTASYGLIGVSGGNTVRFPANGNNVGVLSNSDGYGLFVTVENSFGNNNKTSGYFLLDNDSNVNNNNISATGRIASTILGSSRVAGGYFQSENFGIYVDGGSDNSIYVAPSGNSEIFVDGDVEIENDLLLNAFGVGNKIGAASYLLGVDTTGSLVEISSFDSQLGAAAKFVNDDVTTNINNSIEIPIYGNLLSAVNGFNDDTTLYERINTTNLRVNSDGRYKIIINVAMTSSVTRANTNLQISINNNLVGTIGATGYMRNATNHDTSSINFVEILELTAGDQISVQASVGAGTGTVTFLSAGTSNLYIEKIK